MDYELLFSELQFQECSLAERKIITKNETGIQTAAMQRVPGEFVSVSQAI